MIKHICRFFRRDKPESEGWSLESLGIRPRLSALQSVDTRRDACRGRLEVIAESNASSHG